VAREEERRRGLREREQREVEWREREQRDQRQDAAAREQLLREQQAQGDGGVALALPKSEPKASRGFALTGVASSSAAAGFSFCCTTSALSQPSRIARRHSTR